MNFRFFFFFLFFFFLAVHRSSGLYALEYVEYKKNDRTERDEGRFLLKTNDEIVFESRDSRISRIRIADLLSQKSDMTEFSYFNRKEMLIRLKEEFPDSRGFSLLEKDHFLIVYTTSQPFADWYGRLLERLYAGYFSFWKSRGMNLEEPKTPLVALIFSNQQSFFRYAAEEGNTVTNQTHAYYSLYTNRIVLCDLSGLETFRAGDRGRASSRDIQFFLEQPRAAENISMVVHEATHQIGYNSGMHRRFAPCPWWAMEGLAVLHEVPDHGKKAGWSIRLKTNRRRMDDLITYLQKQPIDPIREIIRSDDPFRDPLRQRNSYAMTWGLTYYLVQRKPKEFSEYLKRLSAKTLFSEDSPELRLLEFEECFGTDWKKLHKECFEYLRKR